MIIYINICEFHVKIIYRHETGKFQLYHATNDGMEDLYTEEHYILNELPNKMVVLIRKYYKI